MRIVVDVTYKKLQIDDLPLRSCDDWPYLRSIRKLRYIVYDTRSRAGQAYYVKPALPPINLSNPIYDEFVDQLISAALDYTSFWITSALQREKIKRH